MPTTTFSCPCCGGAEPTCCAAGDCCFSSASTVTLAWSIVGRDEASDCICPESAITGSIELALEFCTGGIARWSAVTCDAPFTCTGSTLARWHRYRATYTGASNQWQVSFDALADTETGEPCSGVLTCVLFSGQSTAGNCCGVGPIDSVTHVGCCNLSGQITATWSVSVAGNNCCRDEVGLCVSGSNHCDGTCGGLP